MKKKKQKRKLHYLIMSSYIHEYIGCCYDREDVLKENPSAYFERVAKKDCPVCKEYDRA